MQIRKGGKVEVRPGRIPAMISEPGQHGVRVTTTGSEAKLVERLSNLPEGEGWMGVVFAFQRMLEHYRSDYQIKIAINLMKDLLKDQESQIFVGRDAMIVMLVRSQSRSLVDKVVFQLRYLFMDDPLAYLPDGEENPAFCDIHDLSVDRDALMALARRRMLQEARGGREMPNVEPARVDAPAPVAPAEHRPIALFNGPKLAAIETALRHADLSSVMRRQPICAAVPDQPVRKVFDELYISIAHLRDTLDAEVDLLSNRSLFKYLTEILDERVLGLLRRSPGRFLDFPVSLNLNIKTLLSEHFAAFDAAISPAAKVSVVIEVQLSDMFEDMRAFLAVRDQVQRMGYRVCLDGMSDLSFAHIDREALGFDLVKLQWNADAQPDPHQPESRRMADAVRRCGPNRIILTRCDNRRAVEFGHSLGISLFQGRYLDKLMNPLSKIEN